jgi:hypothetical protein
MCMYWVLRLDTRWILVDTRRMDMKNEEIKDDLSYRCDDI